ncbi:MAG: FlgD immunoglobulin-like domain containing protein [bacterium]|nr:FlgD immunoglobulin-like domain containing protein [bacterium]
MAASNSRAYTYYGIPGTPFVLYDGWANQGAPSYADSRWYFDTLKLVAPTPKVTIDLAGTFYNPGAKTGTVKAHVVNVSGVALSGVVHVLITETNISYTWQGQSMLYDVVRSMLPSYSGTTKNLAVGASTDVTQSFTIGGSWNASNCNVVVWYQKTSGKGIQVCQGAKKSITSIAAEENSNKNTFTVKISPNPFTSNANVCYSIEKKENVQVGIYDIAGKLVKQLVNGEQDAGSHTAYWDGKNDLGNKIGAGIYFCVVNSGSHKNVSKIMSVR